MASTEAADQLAVEIPDGASLLLAPDYSGCAMAVIKALIRRQARELSLIGAPQLGLQAELLIAAGCVASVETAAISLGEAGIAPAFEAARRAGGIRIIESTCPAIHAGLQASERHVPFHPLRGVIGVDLLKIRPDWKVIDNPMPPFDPILIVPAIQPDVALFHSPLADAFGNVWVGVRRELMTMAHASKKVLVSAETRQQADLLRDKFQAPGTLPALYVDALEVIEDGGRPRGSEGHYAPDPAFAEAYKAAFKAGETRQFLERWVTDADFAHA
jgi:glutaconate CoA-transferase subunit A